MHILMTGGAGFIGSRAAEAMLDRGWKVTILDLFLDEPASWWTHKGVRLIEGDVRERASVRELLRNVDACWHLAAAHHDSGISEATYFSVNESGTRILCEEMERSGVGDLCFFSTVAIYGPREDRNAPSPVSPYGRSKLAAEKVIRDWVSRGCGKALIVRPAVVFGPGNFANMYALIRQIDRNRYWPVGVGGNVKSMAYIGNLVPSVLERWAALEIGSCEVVNYVDKPDLTSDRIAAVIAGALGRRIPSPSVPAGLARAILTTFEGLGRTVGRPFDLWRRVEKFSISVSLYTSDPRIPGDSHFTLEEGLNRMVEWYLKEGKFASPRRALPPAEVRSVTREWGSPSAVASGSAIRSAADN